MNTEHLQKIAKKGGIERVRLHGNPGTIEGRRKGGLRSIQVHNSKKSAFKTIRKIVLPENSTELAELIGIIAGDGHVGLYQVSMVTNSETDYEHALYVKKLIETLFNLPVSIKKRKDRNACVVLVSSKELCNFFENQGIPRGNKVKSPFILSTWIVKNRLFTRAFIRGLIDTDGCVYEDKHTVGKKTYSSLCIAFTNAAPTLLNFVFSMLCREGYVPTYSGISVRLRRKKDVCRYATEIGFSNAKHSLKYELYFEHKGGVA